MRCGSTGRHKHGLGAWVLVCLQPCFLLIAYKREFQLVFRSLMKIRCHLYTLNIFLSPLWATTGLIMLARGRRLTWLLNTSICHLTPLFAYRSMRESKLPFDRVRPFCVSQFLLCVSSLFYSHSASSRNHLPTRQKMRHRVKAEVGHVICEGSWEM